MRGPTRRRRRLLNVFRPDLARIINADLCSEQMVYAIRSKLLVTHNQSMRQCVYTYFTRIIIRPSVCKINQHGSRVVFCHINGFIADCSAFKFDLDPTVVSHNNKNNRMSHRFARNHCTNVICPVAVNVKCSSLRNIVNIPPNRTNNIATPLTAWRQTA